MTMRSVLHLDRRRAMTLLAGAAAAVSRPAVAAETFKPPLWVVRRRAAKVYLFGEMFAGKDFGPSPKVLAAFNESAEYWKETPPVSPQEFQALMAKFGTAETPLTERLGAADAQRLLAVTTAIKAPPESFQPYRPWLAVLRLQGPLYQSLGVTVQQDAGVTAAAKTADKTVRYEFADGQTLVRYFADMSTEVETEYLRSMCANFEAGRAWWAARAEAWAVGDLSVEEALLKQQARDFPAFLPYITATRNAAWVPRIQTMLEGNAASFVRVGFDHLIGPDSMQRQLERSGLTVERIS